MAENIVELNTYIKYDFPPYSHKSAFFSVFCFPLPSIPITFFYPKGMQPTCYLEQNMMLWKFHLLLTNEFKYAGLAKLSAGYTSLSPINYFEVVNYPLVLISLVFKINRYFIVFCRPPFSFISWPNACSYLLTIERLYLSLAMPWTALNALLCTDLWVRCIICGRFDNKLAPYVFAYDIVLDHFLPNPF